MSIEKSDMIDTISTKRTTGEVIPTVNDHHDRSDTAGFRLREGVPKVRKRLVVNADDFGFTPDVNRGIVDAHRRGILTATTLMANGSAFDDAVRFARETPTLDIGCHLVLIGGSSLVTGKRYPLTAAQLLAALARREIRPYEELAAQVRRIVDAGIRPTHLDTHKHTHLAPPVLDAVARLGDEFGIRWVRQPFDFPLNALRAGVPRLKRMTSGALGLMRRRFHRVLERHGCRTTDHFAGFQITGRFRTGELVQLLAFLPYGSTELMCHPGYCGEALRAARTRLKESRERELEALTAPETRAALARNGIELVPYIGLE
jgi:chitin disaccharide deacetylase